MTMPYTPTERKPTGIPAAPLILVSGPAKAGKSALSYRLVNSDRIHRCWVIDVGEGTADEYADIGPYTVLDWGTSWSDLTESIRWCVAQPVPDGMLNAVIIDSGSDVWEALKDRASTRARGSKKNREALAKDADAEIDVSMNYWNDAASTWAKIVNPLKVAGHLVGVVIVRADEVAEVANGAPTKNRVISLQAHKSLPAIVTAHVQVRPDHSAHLIEVRSLKVTVDPRGQRLDVKNPLAEVIDLLSPSGAGFAAPDVSTPVDDERPGLDPAEQAARVLFTSVKHLDDDRRALFKAWAGEHGYRVSIPEMAGSAPLRAAVAAQVAVLTSQKPELSVVS